MKSSNRPNKSQQLSPIRSLYAVANFTAMAFIMVDISASEMQVRNFFLRGCIRKPIYMNSTAKDYAKRGLNEH